MACPNKYKFCIDTRWSDPQTFLSPNPHLIKRFFDEGCIQSAYGRDRAEKNMEDTYCKDFMSFEGRFCQWTEQVRCECAEHIEDIVFANGRVIRDGDSVPAGYNIVPECIYPPKNIKRMPNGRYVDVLVPGKPALPPFHDDPKLKGNNAPDSTLQPVSRAAKKTISLAAIAVLAAVTV